MGSPILPASRVVMKYAVSLIPLLMFLSPAEAQDAVNKHVLRWHGQSFFSLETADGLKIAIDPHTIPEFGRQSVRADYILHSHTHDDHNGDTAVENYKKAVILNGVLDKGRRWNPIDKTIDGKRTTIRTVGVFHDDEEGMRRGRNSIFVIESDGIVFAHLGDLGHELTPRQLKQLGKVDVLMIPVGGIYTINGSVARRVVEQIKPRLYIIPMHYGVKQYEDLPRIDEFLLPKKPSDFKPIETLEIPLDLKKTEPETILMDYER